jgi:surface carbohydrate biosynthesis protein
MPGSELAPSEWLADVVSIGDLPRATALALAAALLQSARDPEVVLEVSRLARALDAPELTELLVLALDALDLGLLLAVRPSGSVEDALLTTATELASPEDAPEVRERLLARLRHAGLSALEARLLLGLVAAERGHEVLLGDVDPRHDPEAMPPGLFHDKSLTPGQEIVRQAQLDARGFLVTSQDEEHGLLQPDFSLFMARRFDPEALARVDAVMTWGPHDDRALRGARPQHADRLRMTGSPRVDLWRPELAPHHRNVTLPEVAGRPFVLFANNVTHLLGMNRFTTMLADKRGKYVDGTSDPLERLWFDELVSQAERLPHLVASIRGVAERFPDLTVVVRPHPVESVAAWRDLVGPLPNVLIVRDASISPWVRSALAVVHTGDTTGFEAAVAGTPLVSLEPEEGVAVDLGHVTGRLGIRAGDAGEVVEAIGSLRAGTDPATLVQPGADELLAARLAALDGPLAVDRIVDAWEELDAPTAPRMRPDRLTPSALGRLEARARDLVRPGVHAAREVRRRMREGVDADRFVVAHKFPPIDHDALAATARSLAATLGRFDDVELRPVGPRLVHLSRRGPRGRGTSSPTGS